MEGYKNRLADNRIKEYLEIFGAVIVEGARGTGKTTSSRYASKSFVSLDKAPEIAAMAQVDPASIFEGETPRLIDEWQLAPNVWNAVRHEVDDRRKAGQFLLTGSATPTNSITRDSGGGRFGKIRLRTFSLFEAGLTTGQILFSDFFERNGKFSGIDGLGLKIYAEQIIKGGWPETLRMNERSASIYLRNYIEEAAKVDVGDENAAPRISSLIRSISRNISTEASLTGIAGESKILTGEARDETNQSVSVPTARKYLDGLSRVFIYEELPPWSTHIRSKIRQRVSPKLHFIDPSIAATSLGFSSKKLFSEPKTFGLFFESLAIRDLRIYAECMDGAVYHYRDETNLEIDTIVELFDGRWAAFEIKLGGDSFIDEGASNLQKMYKRLTPGKQADMRSLNVLTAGSASYTRPDGVNVVSLGHIGFDFSRL
jgi:predicted AAA+ superfamily ATPase